MTLLGRTHGVEEISREENLKHRAVFHLALGRTIPNVQASVVKMGLDAATEALRWGVNDLGDATWRSRSAGWPAAYHGVKLDPEDLIAAAHAAGRPAAGAHDALRAAPPPPAAGKRPGLMSGQDAGGEAITAQGLEIRCAPSCRAHGARTSPGASPSPARWAT